MDALQFIVAQTPVCVATTVRSGGGLVVTTYLWLIFLIGLAALAGYWILLLTRGVRRHRGRMLAPSPNVKMLARLTALTAAVADGDVLLRGRVDGRDIVVCFDDDMLDKTLRDQRDRRGIGSEKPVVGRGTLEIKIGPVKLDDRGLLIMGKEQFDKLGIHVKRGFWDAPSGDATRVMLESRSGWLIMRRKIEWNNTRLDPMPEADDSGNRHDRDDSFRRDSGVGANAAVPWLAELENQAERNKDMVAAMYFGESMRESSIEGFADIIRDDIRWLAHATNQVEYIHHLAGQAEKSAR